MNLRLVSKCLWLVVALGVAACNLGREEAGSFAVTFTWVDPAPKQPTWVAARVEQGRAAPRLQVAEAPIVAFEPGVKLAFPSVEHGSEYVVVVEIKQAAAKGARTLYFGESKPFALEPGKHTNVQVALALTETPITGPVAIVEKSSAGYVNTAHVTLSLSPARATRVIAANDLALTRGRRERALAELQRDGERYLWRDFDLDGGLCAREPCADERRTVYVQFVNDRGYASEIGSASATLDRIAPTLAAASLAPSIAKAGDKISLVLNPSEPLASPPIVYSTPRDLSFGVLRRVSAEAYVGEHRLEALGVEREELSLHVELTDLAGNRTTATLSEHLLVDQMAPGLWWGAEVSPSVVRDGDAYELSFELDEVVESLPVVRVGNLPVDCAWVGPSMRRVHCQHVASKLEGGGEKHIQVEARDAAGNFAALEAGTIVYDTLPRCGDGVRDVDRYEACDLGAQNSDTPDAACRSNCQAQRCGDRVVDVAHGEVCDDGNLTSGDGCSFDCRSNESCLNGYVDFLLGEECDDGDRQSHDGCLNTCRRDAPAWTRYPSNGTVGQVVWAYDAARARFVSFDWADTWEWDGTSWRQRFPVGALPPPRIGQAMAYDAARKRVVMFGGSDTDDKFLNDTWEWDGSTWERKALDGLAPAARDGAGMVYDAARHQIVLFGGLRRGKYVKEYARDTWAWDGSSWTLLDEGDPEWDASGGRLELDPADVYSSPRPRNYPAMAYDPRRAVVVLFGGNERETWTYGDQIGLNDTWEWNGQSWTERHPTGELPQPRAFHSMVYDPASERVVMFGGLSDEPETDDGGDADEECLGDMWAWDGSAWSEVTMTDPQPRARDRHTMAYDVVRGRVTLFGGRVYHPSIDEDDELLGDIWEWDGKAWTSRLSDDPGPAVREAAAMAYDPLRGRVVLFGGYREHYRDPNGTGYVPLTTLKLDDTWEWDGTTWMQVVPTGTLPSKEATYTMAYDVERRVAVMYGSDHRTWEWDGAQWFDRTPSEPAVYPEGDAMVYDAARREILVIGGSDNGRVGMWEWDGATWTRVAPIAAAPVGRTSSAIAYDMARERVVLFGGTRWNSSPKVDLDDTWEWDGTRWEQKAVDGGGPLALSRHAMAYDATRNRVVLFGGLSPQYGTLDETWEWDGQAWAKSSIKGDVPVHRMGHAMAYDAAHARLVACGGIDRVLSEYDENDFGDTWTFRYDEPGLEESCRDGVDDDGDGLSGCADPDCFGVCTPMCNPTSSKCDDSFPRCGDGECAGVESCHVCPQDCGRCASLCGDFRCDLDEERELCPGDCSP